MQLKHFQNMSHFSVRSHHAWQRIYSNLEYFLFRKLQRKAEDKLLSLRYIHSVHMPPSCLLTSWLLLGGIFVANLSPENLVHLFRKTVVKGSKQWEPGKLNVTQTSNVKLQVDLYVMGGTDTDGVAVQLLLHPSPTPRVASHAVSGTDAMDNTVIDSSHTPTSKTV